MADNQTNRAAGAIGADALVERYLNDVASRAFSWAPARHADKGVTVDDPQRAFQGVTWTYSSTDAAPFFNALRGRQQALPNGIVLIAESATGPLLEVTRDRDVVWEYINPHRSGVNDADIAWIM